jgi:hypothetical protein
LNFFLNFDDKKMGDHEVRPISLFLLLHFVDAGMAFGRQSRIHPSLFAFRVITDVRISHGRQFTGGVF